MRNPGSVLPPGKKRAQRSRPRVAIYVLVLLAFCSQEGFGTEPQSPNQSGSNSPIVNLEEAIRRARDYSQQFQTAAVDATIAHESRVQAKAAQLPTVNGLSQFIYTEGNSTPSGVFIANDGVHVYNEQLIVREDLFSLARRGQYRQAQAAEAVAVARKEIAARGLVFTVVQDYYNLVNAQRKAMNADRALREAKEFADITQKREQAGDVSHVDVVKAELQLEQRQRDLENAKLSIDQTRLALSVLLFPDFNENFGVEDDLGTLKPLLSWNEAQALALVRNPEIRAAEAGAREARFATSVARYAYLPSFALTFYYGIDANQLAAHTDYPTAGVNRSNLPNFQVPSRQNLGYAGDVTLNIPVWDWGATRSKVRQSELRRRQAEIALRTAQRQLDANLRALYREAQIAQAQVASLQRSRDLAAENLKLTLLRYQAGDATALEAVAAQDGLSLARNDYDTGLVRYHVAVANLQTLTGSM